MHLCNALRKDRSSLGRFKSYFPILIFCAIFTAALLLLRERPLPSFASPDHIIALFGPQMTEPRNTLQARNVTLITTTAATADLEQHFISGQLPEAARDDQAMRTKDREMLEAYAKLFQTPHVNCANAFAGVQSDIDRGVLLAARMKESVPLLSNEFYINQTTDDCQAFIESRGYITSYLTDEERDFPIAYSMVVYKDVEMVERQLRAIYRPQNLYCIHVDLKSDNRFLEAVTGIAGCFSNVFLASRQVNVVWGTYSVLEPEIICMQDLWARGKTWKYFINLTGQEFPLKTNWELVKILTAYRGANDVSGTIKNAQKARWKNTVPPRGIRPLKGSVHISVNRKFVDYILHNDTAAALLDWVKTTSVPDETFFATLNHNPQLGIPGTFIGHPDISKSVRFLARYKAWMGQKKPCAGRYVRAICILSTADLPLLSKSHHLFANKFYLNADRVVIGCLEEKHFNDTRDEYLGVKYFNTSYYENQDFVKNQVPVL